MPRLHTNAAADAKIFFSRRAPSTPKQGEEILREWRGGSRMVETKRTHPVTLRRPINCVGRLWETNPRLRVILSAAKDPSVRSLARILMDEDVASLGTSLRAEWQAS